uniref:Cytochrome P450 26A1 n=1 Tax=Leptobrachium leishanense TaxID=445787 RepID=A0A8C5MPE2_9ANUR
METYTVVTSTLCTLILPVILFFLTLKLWNLYCSSLRDWSCKAPLPPGTMGLPFFGETMQMLLNRKRFLEAKRRKYGRIYKTHLFGNPTVRVLGADNVRQILLGEHRLVSVRWPASVGTILGSRCLSNLHEAEHKEMKRVIMQAFSREAMETYVPLIEDEVRGAISSWLESDSSVLVYPAIKRLMFRIAMRILLGFETQEMENTLDQPLVDAFEEMIKNLFSLPIDIPFSGLYRGLRARNKIHAKIEETIKEKMVKVHRGAWKDALQLLIEHSLKGGKPVDLQAIKESATELLFGGHGTTASTATSLLTFLALHKEVLTKVRRELESNGLLCIKPKEQKYLTVDTVQKLDYIGCVLKETLRLNPPVPGGFRIALKTFTLNGYQIPKGWNVIYSIADTHSVADIFPNKEQFDPDRFLTPLPQDASRFNYIPFGGGVRTCVGKEFAKILLKIFIVELCRHCDWELVNGMPVMRNGPIASPADDLPTRFKPFNGVI